MNFLEKDENEDVASDQCEEIAEVTNQHLITRSQMEEFYDEVYLKHNKNTIFLLKLDLIKSMSSNFPVFICFFFSPISLLSVIQQKIQNVEQEFCEFQRQMRSSAESFEGMKETVCG